MKDVIDFTIVSNQRLNERHFLLSLKSSNKLIEMLPGQFVNVLIPKSKETFLRRPFSVHDTDYENNILKLYIQIAGKGTESLANIKVGEKLNIVYPLGNSFLFSNDDKCLLIGGGCGIAPLLFLSKTMSHQGIKPTILIGARTESEIFEVEEYKKYADIYFSTDDGTLGEKGFITKHSIINKIGSNFNKIFACGPELMLKAIAKIALEKNVSCEVSLENTMACGFGVCLCCVTETIQGRQCVCTEGPVFNTSNLSW